MLQVKTIDHNETQTSIGKEIENMYIQFSKIFCYFKAKDNAMSAWTWTNLTTSSQAWIIRTRHEFIAYS